ncbi:GntR family transcriptional regulator, partial [Pseudomonas aeruginosa]|nr:GntR family transcriptional regulator [Pseudomonas aeruginosa]
LFDLLRRNVVTNIGGMYAQRTETRAQLMEQHQRLYAIISGQAELAREVSNQHIHYVQEVLAEVQEEARRMKRSQRRRSVQED